VFQPIKISDPKLPSLEVAAMDTLGKGLFGAAGTNSHNVATSQGSDAGSPMIASQVDKPAVPRDGNPIPKYPSMLESSRIEGSVLVQFVVDTLGRADMSTFAIFESSNDLFAESFKTTLPRWRFYPAEAGGRKVEQVVQLPLKFIAPPR